MTSILGADPFTFMSLVLLGGFFIYIGWVERNKERTSDTSTAITIRRKLLAPSLFVVIGAGEYGLAVSLVVSDGVAGVSFLIGLAAAMLIIASLMPTIMSSVSSASFPGPRYDGYQSISTPDYIFSRFGRISSLVASIVTVLAFWGILLLQFLVGGTIISALSGAPIFWSVTLMVIIVAAYTSIGGFTALFFTDFWQSILMWVSLATATVGLFLLHGNTPEFQSAYGSFKVGIVTSWKTESTIYLFLITVIAAFSGPDLWQRANMAYDSAEAKFSLRAAAFGVFMFAILIAYFSVDVQTVLSTQAYRESGNELIQYLSLVVSTDSTAIPQELVWPEWLRVVFATGVLSAFVSTADTSAMLVTTTMYNEVQRGKTKFVEANRNVTKSIIVLTCVSAGLASLYTTDIAHKFTAILGILGVLGIPTFFALIGRGTKSAFMLAVISGSTILITQAFVLTQYNTGLWLFAPFIPGLLCGLWRIENSYAS